MEEERSVETRRRLAAVGLELYEMTPPFGSYAQAKLNPNTDTIYVSGQLPIRDRKLLATGKIERDIPFADGAEHGRRCAGMIFEAIDSVADLDRVDMLMLFGFVACDPAFYEPQLLVEETSKVLIEGLGEERGTSARIALPLGHLPKNATMEVCAIARVIR